MYAGDDRVRQTSSLRELAANIAANLGEGTAEDLVSYALSDEGRESWGIELPEWFNDHDRNLLTRFVAENLLDHRLEDQALAISIKIAKNVDPGLWAIFGDPMDDYTVSAWLDLDAQEYVLSFHKGRMPAFNSRRYQTLAQLETAMRDIEPDLRKWKTRIEA